MIGRTVLISLVLLACGRAHAADYTKACVPESDKDEFGVGDLRLLSHEQFLFLEGIYALDPQTPPGLPYGTEALIGTKEGRRFVLFRDGDLLCTPFAVPKELEDMLDDVGGGVVKHEGGGL